MSKVRGSASSTVRPRRRLSRLGTTVAGVAVTALALTTIGPAHAAPPAEVSTTALCGFAPRGAFADVVPGSTFEQYIDCLSHLGLTDGVTEGRYVPGGTVTREQMASFVARMIDEAAANDSSLRALPAVDGINRFLDVDAGGTHASNINRLYRAGVVLGLEATGPVVTAGEPCSPLGARGRSVTFEWMQCIQRVNETSPNWRVVVPRFGPSLVVTRKQMATFIARAIEYLRDDSFTPVNDYFTDDDGDIHESNINLVAMFGIAIGRDDGSFGPNRSLNRGQMSAFIVRAMAWITADVILPPPTTTTSTTALETTTTTSTTSTTMPPTTTTTTSTTMPPTTTTTTVAPDETPAEVIGDTADVGGTTFGITFDEPVEAASAADAARYSVRIGGSTVTVVTATVDGLDAVTLTLAEGATIDCAAGAVTLDQTVDDLAGNTGDQTGYELVAACIEA